MTIKPLSAQGLKPSRVQGFLHPWALLPGCFLSYLPRLLNFLTSQLRRSPFFSPAPLLPCSRALLFLLSLAPLLLGPSAVVLAQPGWGPDVKLTNFINKAEESPKVACVGNYVHVVWYEEAGGAGYYLRSTDNGAFWGSPFRLWDSLGYQPSIAASDSFVHVAWLIPSPTRCVYRRSSDNGATWGRFDTVTFSGYGLPFLAVAGDTVYLLAYDTFRYREVIMKSTNSGLSWGPVQNVAPMFSRGGFALHTPYLHVSLEKQDSITVSTEQYYNRSTDGGTTWSTPLLISQCDSIHSYGATIGVDLRGNVHVGWKDYKYSPYPLTGDVFYRPSRDSGRSWGVIDSLTVMHRATTPNLVAQGDTLHLVWVDDRVQPDVNTEIFYRMSTDLGATWGSEARLTFADRESYGPNLAVGDTFLHLVWTDSRPDTIAWYRQIYYKRKSLFYSGVEEETALGQKRNGSLLRVYPNPSKGLFRIYSSLEGVLGIYDVSGRRVRVLTPYDSRLTHHEFFWDGRDEQGRGVKNGIYVLKVSKGGKEIRRKVVVVR